MVTITSELAFTFYTSAFGFFNLIGHILKIVAFFLLYKAIISIGLRNPIDLLYRQLKLSEIKYRNLVENIPNVIYSTSPDKTRTTTFISERWKEWTGVSPADHYSEDNAWSKTIHPDDQDGVKNKFNEAISLKKEYDFEYSVIHKDTGEVFYLRDQGVPIKDDVNNINRYDGIISNITLRKKFEHALKKSENDLKGRIKEITCLYQISDLALNFDKTESDLVNEILEIIPSAFRFPEITCARIIFDGNEFTSKNFTLTDCNIKTDIRVYDKKLGTIEIYYTIPDVNKSLFVKEEKDLIRAIAGIISRFSEHKKAEEKLEQFVSTVSHELRNPIAVLLMSLNYLEKYSENIMREQESNLMKGIMRNVNLLNELVNDLLTLSRLDEKKMILDWIEYFPFKVISDVLDLIEPNLKLKNISVSLDINKDLSLYGDISRINQIFRIFIENAWKYSNNESTIVIKAIDHYSGIFNSEGIDGVLFQIIDSGIGIHEKDIPYIFDRFYRSNSVKDIPGTGLGLTIAKDLIQLHQGKVFVTSEYGSGATFSIFFPRILN
jgi:PAS domain S-box-containing protein